MENAKAAEAQVARGVCGNPARLQLIGECGTKRIAAETSTFGNVAVGVSSGVCDAQPTRT